MLLRFMIAICNLQPVTEVLHEISVYALDLYIILYYMSIHDIIQ